MVNKHLMVKTLAAKTGMTEKVCARMLGAVAEVLREAVARGEHVRLPGFGVFFVRERAARRGRNPQTGEEFEIPAGKAIVFRPGGELRRAVAE
ncbi:MAG: HU family DNA-binding protein [Thermoanaerobacterales bacterium]|nr:HU family DNA-binding protein [Thermoanaerobacterales bacterium]